MLGSAALHFQFHIDVKDGTVLVTLGSWLELRDLLLEKDRLRITQIRHETPSIQEVDRFSLTALGRELKDKVEEQAAVAWYSESLSSVFACWVSLLFH